VTIDELDKEIVAMLGKLKVGEISAPTPFTDEQRSKKGRKNCLSQIKIRTSPDESEG
jgi:hypothetical protein